MSRFLQRWLNGLLQRPGRLWALALLWTAAFFGAFAWLVWTVRTPCRFEAPVQFERQLPVGEAHAGTVAAIIRTHLPLGPWQVVRPGDRVALVFDADPAVEGTVRAADAGPDGWTLTLTVPGGAPAADGTDRLRTLRETGAVDGVVLTLRCKRLLAVFLR
ncbi:MAG: hypothetical protein JXR37_16990 [Kiritimatiellae bacterium]|nr:hypothetical protein [Kiritimatiellia bacterium]